MSSSPVLPEPVLATEARVSKRSHSRNPFSAVFRFFLRQWLFMFCIFLHLIVVGVHVILIVFDFQKHQFLAKETLTTDLIFLAVVMAPTAIVRTYIVILLLVTQQLAMKRNYHVRQSLAALHEKSAAWMGLGSAATGLWRQRKLRAARLSVFLILLYLIGLFVLGISTPALINVTYVSDNDPIFTHTTRYLAHVNSSDIINAFPVVNILPLLDVEVFTIGYTAGTIFDVPNFVGREVVPASAVEFTVTCGEVPNIAQSGNVSSVNMTVDGSVRTVVTYPFQVHPSLQDVNVSPVPQTLSILSTQPTAEQSTQPPPVIIVAATGMSIVNDPTGLSKSDITNILSETIDGQPALSIADINPPVIPSGCNPSSGTCASVTSIQILACNVQATNTTIQVDVEEAQAHVSDAPEAAQWQNWTLPAVTTQPYLAPVGSFAAMAPLGDTVQTFQTTIGSQTVTSTHNSSLLEDNLALYFTGHGESTQITLGELNFALEQALAVVYWRATFQRALRERPAPGHGPGAFEVQVNTIAPWIGLGVSSVLLLIAIILTRQPGSSPRALDTIGAPGVLQLAWLLGRVPHLAAGISGNVDNPSADELLRAGKEIKVKMCDHIEAERGAKQRKSVSDSSKAGSDSEQAVGQLEAEGDLLDTVATLPAVPVRGESESSVQQLEEKGGKAE